VTASRFITEWQDGRFMMKWNGYESRKYVADFEAMSRYSPGKASKKP
jgi:hypothetical protein